VLGWITRRAAGSSEVVARLSKDSRLCAGMHYFLADVYTTLSSPGCAAAVMGHPDQAALANTLFK
jgi:hypothetical protein